MAIERAELSASFDPEQALPVLASAAAPAQATSGGGEGKSRRRGLPEEVLAEPPEQGQEQHQEQEQEQEQWQELGEDGDEPHHRIDSLA
jgi:hypothetical protein